MITAYYMHIITQIWKCSNCQSPQIAYAIPLCDSVAQNGSLLIHGCEVACLVSKINISPTS